MSLGKPGFTERPDSTDRRQLRKQQQQHVCVYDIWGTAAFLDEIMGMGQPERLIHLKRKEMTFWGDKRKHNDGDNNTF